MSRKLFWVYLGIKRRYFMIKIGVSCVSGVVTSIVRDRLRSSGPEGVPTGRESPPGAARESQTSPCFVCAMDSP